MTEQVTTAPTTAPAPAPSTAPPTTGVPVVDAVLSELATAFSLPVAEQSSAVERAHDRLRRALDEPGPAT